MHLQGSRLEVYAPTCPPSCASERDHFEILKHTAKGVGRKIFRRGVMGKTKPKDSTIKPPSTLSVLCLKIQGWYGYLPLAADAMHTATNACCRLFAV